MNSHRGADLPQDRFVALVVARVRELLPAAIATRRGRLVILRRGDEAVTIDEWRVWREGAQRRVMLSIGDQRDASVASIVAESIANALR
jgi:hypothetical protein